MILYSCLNENSFRCKPTDYLQYFQSRLGGAAYRASPGTGPGKEKLQREPSMNEGLFFWLSRGFGYVIIPTYKWRAHVSRTISQIQLLNKDYSLTDLTRRSWTRQSAVKPGRSRSAPGRRRALGIFGRCSKLVLFFNFAPLDWLSAPPRGVSRVWCQVSWVQPPDVMFAESTMECKILRRLGYKLCSDNSLLAI